MRKRAILPVLTLTLAWVFPCLAQPPLTAVKTVTVTKPGEKEPRLLSKALLYYDSQQRFRQDETNFSATGGATETSIDIIDPVAQKLFRLSPTTKRGEERHFRAPRASDLPPGELGSPAPAGSFVVRPAGELGDQRVEGRECYGTVYGESPLFQWSITWWDKETGLPILEIVARKDGSVVKTTITEIKLGDPDPLLFTVPQGYAVTRMGE